MSPQPKRGQGNGEAQAEPTAAERREAEQQGQQREPRYSKADLLREPGLVDSTAADVAGALAAAKVDDDAELTPREVEKLLKDFRGRTVEHAAKPEED